MKLHVPVYHALILAQLSQGQDAEPKCNGGSGLYAGGWAQVVTPSTNVACPKAVLTFLPNGESHTLPIKQGGVICEGYRSINISVPSDAPIGLAKLTWLCDSDDTSPCHIVSVEAETRLTNVMASVTEFEIVQNCVAGIENKTENANDDSSRHSTRFDPTWPISSAGLAATTPKITPGTAPTNQVTHPATTYGTLTLSGTVTPTSVAIPPTTSLPVGDTDIPSHKTDETRETSEGGSVTGPLGGSMTSATVVTSATSDERDQETTPIAGNTAGTAPGALEVTQTPEPALPSGAGQGSSNDGHCVCSQMNG